jgi:hypothetical protein
VNVNPEKLSWCPRVSSLHARDHETDDSIIMPVRCKRWSCPYCRDINEILLKERVIDGSPTKLLTLTARPIPNVTPLEAYRKLKPSVSRLYQRCRRRTKKFEAATFVEIHKSGWPHFHALVRSNYLEQAWISDQWRLLTDSFVVDIRKIKHPGVATAYVTKYVTKQLAQHGELRFGQVCSFTRNYSKVVKPDRGKMDIARRDTRHPQAVVRESFAGWWVQWTGRTARLRHKAPEAATIVAEQWSQVPVHTPGAWNTF